MSTENTTNESQSTAYPTARYINFYDDFSCLCGACPATCCKGWLIPVDDNTLEKYNHLQGIDYLKFKLSLREKSGIKCFNTNLTNCAFHDKDGLCSLQKKYGEGYLSEVCRIFPRTVYHVIDSGTESNSSTPCGSMFMELSCPKASELFVANINKMSVITAPHTIGGEIITTNDDYDYYRFLIKLNDELINIINSNHTLHELYAFLNNLGHKLQNMFISEDSANVIETVEEHLLNHSLFDFVSDNARSSKRITDANGITHSSETFVNAKETSTTPTYYLDATTIDKIMTGGYYHKRVKGESELLYRLCRLYFKEFDKMKISDIDSLLKNLTSEIITDPSLNFAMDDFLKNHLWYTLSASFMEIFEDYSFQSKFLIAIIRNSMLSLFLYLYSKNIAPITADNLVTILYSFSRRGAGSDGLYADFARMICASLLTIS